MRIFLAIVTLSIICLHTLLSQTQVAITIDDVPNTSKYRHDNFNTHLLNTLDSLQIPIAIFINYGKLENNGLREKNEELLSEWLKREYITAANHTYSHLRYSAAGFDAFKEDVEKGELFRNELPSENNKRYFRFPFNDLGKDSVQHTKIKTYLRNEGFIIAPHTVESSDWMFSYLYDHYLKTGEKEKAHDIATTYVTKTIEYFDFYDSLAQAQYGRNIKHVYLCHDNTLNADYLPQIIRLLKEKHYSFISLDEALEDPVYKQKDNYYYKWGVSWLYRWMQNPKERSATMKLEPEIVEYYQQYEALLKNN